MRGRMTVALISLVLFASSACTSQQADHASKDIADVLLTILLVALLFAVAVALLIGLAAGLIAKGLFGLRKRDQPPPPPAWGPPGAAPPPPQPAQQMPDRSSAWATLVAGTVLAIFVLPIGFRMFNFGRGDTLAAVLPIAIVVAALYLIRRGPPRSGNTPPPPPAAPPMYYPPPPPPPASAPPQVSEPSPAARPRRREPLRAPNRDPGADEPRGRD